MDFLTVLAPTLWCNYLFGFSSHIVNSNGLRHSRLLTVYRYFICVIIAFLQLTWFAQHLYFKYWTRALMQVQENILLFCVACNITISLLPFKSLFSYDSILYQLLYRISKYERGIFITKRRKLQRLLLGNIILLVSGVMVPVTFTCLEGLKTWTSYSIGKHNFLTDITGLSSGFLRPTIDIILLDSYFMYIVIFGTTYANINESLTRFVAYSNSMKRKHGSVLFLKYLKILEDVDNILRDFHGEILGRLTPFCILVVVLALCNWFYLIGFIFLNLSPLFLTYHAWVVFFTIIFGLIICGNVYAQQQVERTPALLHKLYSDVDEPRIMEEVEILSLQFLHRKVEFDAGGFFKLDFSLLLSMIGTVTTYVLILIQFEDPGIARKCHLNQTNLSLMKNCTGF